MLNRLVSEARQRVGVVDELGELAGDSIADMLLQTARNYPDNPAFTCLGKTVSYAELERDSRWFAGFLQHHTSLQPGDRIALQLPNLLQYLIAFFGAIRSGLVVVNVNPLYTERELLHQFVDSGAKAVVVYAGAAVHVQDVIHETQIDKVIVTEVADMRGFILRTLINTAIRVLKRAALDYDRSQVVSFREVLQKGAQVTMAERSGKRDDLAVLQYTGGTTGRAKGAMLTHHSIVSCLHQVRVLLETTDFKVAAESMALPLPLYHIYANLVCLLMVATANHVLLIPDPRNLAALVRELNRRPPTIFIGLTTLFVALCANDKFTRLNFDRLHIVISGGMPLTEDAARRWWEVTGVAVSEGYGLTESSGVVSVNPPNAIQPGTVGIPLPGTQIRIVNNEGLDMPDGQAGELWVRGPQIMRGYWQAAEAAAEVLTPDGWFKTGDIAELTAQGYLKIVDRKKDMIIVSGFNVYPAELENILSLHPKIRECAVIGVPDPRTGEAVKAVVVATDPALTESEVIAYCRESLTGYKVPHYVEFRRELPKSNVGKVLKRELRKPLQDKPSGND